MPTAALPNTSAEASITRGQLSTVLHRAGVAPLNHTGWLRFIGADRVRWLNGMATNAVQELSSDRGNYNFFLNAQGRIQGDGNIFAGLFGSPNAIFLETSQSQITVLVPWLDHYIIMDDVELADISSSHHGVTLIGPEASAILAKLGLTAGTLTDLQSAELIWNAAPIILIRAHSPLVPRFELWTRNSETRETVTQALISAGASLIGAAALEILRILEGTPLYGVDIRNSETTRDLPQETNQTRALHFSKGCYLGQEIVERIRSRGQVHRTFSAFRLEGAAPAPGTLLEASGKPVGELTSVLALEGLPTIALGYARREALDRAEPLHYAGGIAYPVPTPPGANIQLAL